MPYSGPEKRQTGPYTRPTKRHDRPHQGQNQTEYSPRSGPQDKIDWPHLGPPKPQNRPYRKTSKQRATMCKAPTKTDRPYLRSSNKPNIGHKQTFKPMLLPL